ncbi:DUF2934 domain-containing protein [Shinella sp.]|uniref:DUF2934 domain-containing protein n=1 Tax=Shinella sp. TaxID=1870904 RepID=UPI0028A9D7E0|nr:DUF2934 domain-containing protein [Shinella sp.]
MTDPRERRITARAFDLWQAEGALDGRSLSHWLQAEKEVDEELAQESQKDQVEPVALAGVVNPH